MPPSRKEMLKTILDWQCDFGRPLTPVDAVQWFDAVVAAGWVFDNDGDTWEYAKEMHERNGCVLDCIVTDRLVGYCLGRVLHGSSVVLKAASQAGSNHPYAQAARENQPNEEMEEMMEFCRTRGLENTTRLVTTDGTTDVKVAIKSEAFIEFARYKGRDGLAAGVQKSIQKLQDEWAQEDKEKNFAAHTPVGQF